MIDLVPAISHARDAVCAVMRIRLSRPSRVKKGRQQPAQFQVAFVGTAFGIVDHRYLLTAHHVFNGGEPRKVNDRFYLFLVPQNGPVAYHYPVIGFPLEDLQSDMAVLEVGPTAAGTPSIRALPVTLNPLQDGDVVFTYGFPAPAISSVSLAPDGTYGGGGNFFLKAHANEGIIAASYPLNGTAIYEFNVGWYNGESGGPVMRPDPLAAIAVMQQYRNIQAIHGIVPGPHSGRPVSLIAAQLRQLGATVI
jgi:hypothetical protein